MRRAAAALAAVFLPTSPIAAYASPIADDDERMRLEYALYVGGFSAMKGTVRVNLAPDRYETTLEAATQGLADFIVSWTARAVTRGTRNGGDFAPHEHRSDNVWRGEPRSVALQYGDDRSVTAKAEPDPATDDRDPVPPPLTRGAVDPLSAFVAVMENLRRGADCNRSTAAFDGRRRFDMIFRDRGSQPLPPGGYSSFAGTARLCRVEYVAVAGYRRKQERSIFWRGPDGERPPVDIWFAPLTPGGSPAPVRMETHTPLGQVVVHLIHFSAEK